MVADIFKRDYDLYTARGVKFTPEDIVRLNALAVKVKLCQRPRGTVHLPRCCFLPKLAWWAPGVVLREPTIAHEIWLEVAETYIDTTNSFNWVVLNSVALSIGDPRRLPDVNRPDRLIRKVYRYFARHLANYTLGQLRDAVYFCIYGNGWMQGEHAPEKPKDGESDPSERSPSLGLIAEARAIRLPITTEDAMRMTASELIEAENRAVAYDERFDAKDARNHAFGNYVRARNEIVARSGISGREAR